MKHALVCFFFTLALVFSMPGYSQLHDPFVQPKFQFDKLDHIKALEDLTVTSIIQDADGFIWFGTLTGLIRYDGHGIKHYRHENNDPNSLASNSVRALAKDGNGNLWIATQGGGLDKLEITHDRFVHYQHNPQDTLSIADNSLWSVFVDSRGMVWAGTYSDGLVRLDPSANKFVRIKEDKFNPIRAIIEDADGMIWFSSNGVCKVNPDDLELTRYSPGKGDPVALSTGNIRSLYQDKEGRIWLAVDDSQGVFSFHPDINRYVKVSLFNKEPVSAYTICDDSEGRLWIGTNRGIAVMAGDEISYYQPDPCDASSLRKKVILALYRDGSGAQWIGTEGGGPSKVLVKKKFKLFQYRDTKNILSHNSIRSLHEDRRGRIWIGWVEGGVDIFDPATNILNPFNTAGADNITSIYQDHDSSMWIGTWGQGLLHFSESGKLIESIKRTGDDNSIPDNRVQAILRDHRGVMWVGTENGLSMFDDKRRQWVPFKTPHFPNELLGSNVQSLAFTETKDGSLWVGTWLGLTRISPDRQSTTYFNTQRAQYPLSGDHVISLCVDEKARVLWVGTFEAGLNKLDIETGRITHYTETNGLPDNTIFGARIDTQGDLWLSTNDGLSRFHAVEWKSQELRPD